jgi:hypothetical protein
MLKHVGTKMIKYLSTKVSICLQNLSIEFSFKIINYFKIIPINYLLQNQLALLSSFILHFVLTNLQVKLYFKNIFTIIDLNLS